MVFSMSDAHVRGRIGEAMAASVDEDWTDVLVVGRSRNGNVRLLWHADIITALGLVQAADIAIRAPIRITAAAEAPSNATITDKGTN